MRVGSAFRMSRLAAAVISAVAVAAACSSGSGSGTGPSSSSSSSSSHLEKTHLTVAYLKIIQGAALFIAIKHGFFAQQGLTVTPEAAAASTAAIAGMERGSIDVVAAANYVTFFQLQASGAASVKLLAPAANCDANSNEVLALKGSGITKPSDLAGKTVAVQINPNIQTLTLNANLAADGVNYKTVKYVPITFSSMPAALAAHRVDAISLVEPFISEAKAAFGAAEVMSQCTGPTAGVPQAGYISTASWAARYPNTARSFAKAIDEAQALASSSPASVVSVLPGYIPITSAVAAHVDLGIFPAAFDGTALQNLANMMLGAGMLKSSLNVTPLLLSGG